MKMLSKLFVSALVGFGFLVAFSPAVLAADPRPLYASVTWDPGSLADGVGESKTVTAKGARLGDFCAGSLGVSTVSILLSCSVTATDTVILRLQNETTGTVDLATSTARVVVWRVQAGG